ncbi:MAG: bifunctional folylpolyglutamate synthase/dihydrofolate synthase [Oscillospiraceae bacterium]|nr:bifunctional folylpolyglutamate synthase/dihydrofolate synthase [Oscillospiraceae bacterium]
MSNALDYIRSFRAFGSKPGLERVTELCARLGNPQRGLPCVHVAGSAGKGSTCALLAAMLRADGRKTGLFTSPGVESFHERIQIDGAHISDAALELLTEQIKPHADAMREKPTEFEIVTALGFLHFAREGADVAVMEVGLGGRYDATNIIESPLCAVITDISLDHTDVLGGTVAEIAYQKAGIIKRGCPAVTACGQDPAALEVLLAVSGQEGARLTLARECEVLAVSPGKTLFTCGSERYATGLCGAHQARNAALALAAAEQLGISPRARREGLLAAKLAGRFELVRGNPPCVLDGAHNGAKVDALARTVDEVLACRPVTAIMGMSADKDAEYCVPAIARRAARFIAVQAAFSRSGALTPQAVAALARGHCAEVMCESDVQSAVQTAAAMSRERDVLLVCGSMYILGEAKRALARLSRACS